MLVGGQLHAATALYTAAAEAAITMASDQSPGAVLMCSVT